MALFDQVCRYNDDGTPRGDGGSARLDISVDKFISACGLMLTEIETVESVKTKLGLSEVVDASGKSDVAEFDEWVAIGLAFTTNANADIRRARRTEFLLRTKDFFYMQNNGGWSGLITPNDVRAALGVSLATYGE